ncbi:MAG TPA: UPF0236 family protein [Lactovum miscens]|uniref:UPF0236 family transposase-like protein n=1 Tax=Lactovum miscens TaxID=190387 RepID=UPI002EDA8419
MFIGLDRLTRRELVYFLVLSLEMLDTQLVGPMREKGYQIARRRSRTVSFLFGTVTFRRRSFVKVGEVTFYPVDHLLGLAPKQRQSKYVQNVFAQASTLGVFRKVSELINLVSSLMISHQQLQQLSKQIGQEIDRNQSNALANAPTSGTRKVKILYLEGDAFSVGKQGGGNFYLHRLQVCEGRKRVEKQRTELRHYQEFIDLDREKAFEALENYLDQIYDLCETLIVSNSDEGSGYQKSDFDSLCGEAFCHEHFVDRYHVNKKIKERLKFVPELVKDFQQALYVYTSDSLVPLFTIRLRACVKRQKNLRTCTYFKPIFSAIGTHSSLSNSVPFSKIVRRSLESSPFVYLSNEEARPTLE